jgi:hypothetical protein
VSELSNLKKNQVTTAEQRIKRSNLERFEIEWAEGVRKLAEESKVAAALMKKQNDAILMEIDDAIATLQKTVKAVQENKEEPQPLTRRTSR